VQEMQISIVFPLPPVRGTDVLLLVSWVNSTGTTTTTTLFLGPQEESLRVWYFDTFPLFILLLGQVLLTALVFYHKRPSLL
jgi:hypothetical protein